MKKAILVWLMFLPLSVHANDIDIKFGIINFNKSKGWHVKQETMQIPYKPVKDGVGEYLLYGVIVKEKKGKPFTGKMIHYYPGLSISWLPFDNPNGKKEKKEISDFPSQFAKTGFWGMIETLHEGDPLGKHKLEIYIDEKLYEVIEFEVVEGE